MYDQSMLPSVRPRTKYLSQTRQDLQVMATVSSHHPLQDNKVSIGGASESKNEN